MPCAPRIRGRARVGACVAVLAALTTLPAAAQDTGTVSGTVLDSSGQVVPGAAVTLTNEATGDVRAATSGTETGAFVFRAVPPGTYTVRIELQGFRTFEQTRNVVNASGRLDLGNLKLEIGQRAITPASGDRTGDAVALGSDADAIYRANRAGRAA